MTTDFYQYDKMTWDAVASLPRDVPLVLPLGSGYNLNLLASQLSNPPLLRIGLLPPFPYGWRGSGLEVPDQIFAQYIFNLLDSLRDDGFSRVYCLAPAGLDPQSTFILHSSFFILHPSPPSPIALFTNYPITSRFRTRKSDLDSNRSHRTTWLPPAPLG